MRGVVPLLVCLSACAGAPVEEPDDPAELLELLDHQDPFRREEAAHRLSILGQKVPLNEDTERMRDRLFEAILQREPQMMLWRAYHILRLGALGRPWARVEAALAQQGLRFTEIYEPHERAKFVRYTLEREAYVNEAGDRHELFFWVQSICREDGWTVREVYVGLNAKFEAPFKQLSARDRYPRQSVLGRFFALEDLQKLAVVFPLIEDLELSYGRIRLKDADGAPAGFQVTAGFLMDAKAGGRTVSYTAESGLDPRETRRGRLAWDGFEQSEAVGPLMKRGAGYWGAGMPRPADD